MADTLDEARRELADFAAMLPKASHVLLPRSVAAALCDELALLREYHGASEALLVASDAEYRLPGLPATERIAAARTALAAWKAGR